MIKLTEPKGWRRLYLLLALWVIIFFSGFFLSLSDIILNFEKPRLDSLKVITGAAFMMVSFTFLFWMNKTYNKLTTKKKLEQERVRTALFRPTLGILSGLYIALFWCVQFARIGMLSHALAFFLTFLFLLAIFMWVYLKNKQKIK